MVNSEKQPEKKLKRGEGSGTVKGMKLEKRQKETKKTEESSEVKDMKLEKKYKEMKRSEESGEEVKDMLKEMEKVHKELEELKGSLLTEVGDMRKEMAEMRVELQEQKKSVIFFSENYDEIIERNKVIEEELAGLKEKNKEMVEENDKLKEDIERERAERIEEAERIELLINPLEMERRADTLELHGCPEAEKENCKEAALKLLKRVVPDVIDSMVVQAYRVGKYDQERKRPILVRFNSRPMRNKVFANRGNLKKLTPDSKGSRFYINENLPSNLRALLGKANALRKEKGYNFLWSNGGGIILVKKNETSKTIAIRKGSDLKYII